MTSAAACTLALALAACGDNSDRDPFCGDLVCELGETVSSCATDCGCGNGITNPGEECDGADFGDATCESMVQHGGTLACKADCTFDVSRCDEYMCGNGVVEPGEQCDGSDVMGATCASVGFSEGAVACDASCRFDVSGCCNNFCATANTSVCAGDTVERCVMQSNGCLAIEATNCAIEDDVCDDTGGTATCICVDQCPSAGFGSCTTGGVAQTCMMQADGCLALVTNEDCSVGGEACAIGPQGSTCVPANSGEDCSDTYPITTGLNVVAWNATTANYVTSTTQTSCNTSSLTGPDIVLEYTATVDGIVTYSMTKQTSHRHVIVVSPATCGTVATASAVSCAGTDFFSATAMGDTFAVTQGTTYRFYVRDTTSGSSPLPNPLVLDVSEAACTSLTNSASNLSPANGEMLATTAPVLSLDLQHPINKTVGVITLTGTMGTNVSYDLSTSPSQVTFTNDGRTVTIDPTAPFQPGETITVSWSGVVDEFCGAPIAPPTWSFSIITPSCTPGVGGMVGTNVTRITTGIASFTENYVAADSSPTGYVYLGGSSDLYRVPKMGGPVEDVDVAAGITSTPLGEAVLIVGNKIFTLDTTTSATTPFLWRLSTSGGTTWNPLGYAQYAMTPGDSAYSMFEYKGRIYIATNETTSGATTQIWSVSASAVSLPETPVLEASFSGEEDCDGLAGDDQYFYLTCDNGNDHIIRLDRSTQQTEVITSAIPLSTTKNELHAHDLNGDGKADVLYVKNDDESVRYICGPSAAGPFWQDILATFGSTTTTSNFGLGFDPVSNVLWALDDDTRELIKIQ
jgi:hypothetical protein